MSLDSAVSAPNQDGDYDWYFQSGRDLFKNKPEWTQIEILMQRSLVKRLFFVRRNGKGQFLVVERQRSRSLPSDSQSRALFDTCVVWGNGKEPEEIFNRLIDTWNSFHQGSNQVITSPVLPLVRSYFDGSSSRMLIRGADLMVLRSAISTLASSGPKAEILIVAAEDAAEQKLDEFLEPEWLEVRLSRDFGAGGTTASGEVHVQNEMRPTERRVPSKGDEMTGKKSNEAHLARISERLGELVGTQVGFSKNLATLTGVVTASLGPDSTDETDLQRSHVAAARRPSGSWIDRGLAGVRDLAVCIAVACLLITIVTFGHSRADQVESQSKTISKLEEDQRLLKDKLLVKTQMLEDLEERLKLLEEHMEFDEQ